MQRAGEVVDLLAFDLVAGVVEEVGHTAHAHSINAMCRQRQEGFQVGSAPAKHEGAATLGVQLELVKQDALHFAEDALEVHALWQACSANEDVGTSAPPTNEYNH